MRNTKNDLDAQYLDRLAILHRAFYEVNGFAPNKMTVDSEQFRILREIKAALPNGDVEKVNAMWFCGCRIEVDLWTKGVAFSYSVPLFKPNL